MNIYFRSIIDGDIKENYVSTEGKLMGIKVEMKGALYYIEDEGDGRLKIRSLKGNLKIMPRESNSVLVEVA